MINKSTDGKIRVLSLSYGKDSLACLGAIEQLGLPLDRIIHAEVWATDTIPADLPPMMEFKKKADEIIKSKYGYDVEHICAMRQKGKTYGVFKQSCEGGVKLSYERLFYTEIGNGKHKGYIKGFPTQTRGMGWCRRLKFNGESDIPRYVLSTKQERNGNGVCKQVGKLLQSIPQKNSFGKCDFSYKSDGITDSKDIIQYLGIASDEQIRIERHQAKQGIEMPLVMAGWTEKQARKWCEENDLLLPIYTTATRGGCWFCHNQGVDQLRQLRHNYPDYWKLLMKWDLDSPVTFHADGHTIHDFDERFQLEDDGYITKDDKWHWSNNKCIQVSIFQEENKRGK